MSDNDFSTWTTTALIEYEQQLYDREIADKSTWAQREKVLLELDGRGFITKRTHGLSAHRCQL